MLRYLRLAYPDKPAQRRLTYHVYLISERVKNSRIQVRKFIRFTPLFLQSRPAHRATKDSRNHNKNNRPRL